MLLLHQGSKMCSNDCRLEDTLDDTICYHSADHRINLSKNSTYLKSIKKEEVTSSIYNDFGFQLFIVDQILTCKNNFNLQFFIGKNRNDTVVSEIQDEIITASTSKAGANSTNKDTDTISFGNQRRTTENKMDGINLNGFDLVTVQHAEHHLALYKKYFTRGNRSK